VTRSMTTGPAPGPATVSVCGLSRRPSQTALAVHAPHERRLRARRIPEEGLAVQRETLFYSFSFSTGGGFRRRPPMRPVRLAGR